MQRPSAAHGHVGRELLRDSRLPDTRLAHDHDQRALARQRAVEGGLQLAQLWLAADEGPAVEGVAAVRLIPEPRATARVAPTS